MKYTDVYLKTEAPLSDVAELVRREFALDLELFDDPEEPIFVAHDGHRRIEVGINEFLEPEYGAIAEFSHYISVDGYDNAARQLYARNIFDQLAKMQRMPLLFVDELVILDRYDPP